VWSLSAALLKTMTSLFVHLLHASQRPDNALNCLSTVLRALRKCKGPRDFYCETIVVCCKLCSIILTARRDHALKKKLCKALLRIAKQSRHEKPYPPNITQLAAETLARMCNGYSAGWTKKFRKRVKRAKSKCSKQVQRVLRCVIDDTPLTTAVSDESTSSRQRSRSHSQHSDNARVAQRRTHYEPSPTAQRSAHYGQPSSDRRSYYEPEPRRHSRTHTTERSHSPSYCSNYARPAQRRRTHYEPSPTARSRTQYEQPQRTRRTYYERSPTPQTAHYRPASRRPSRSRTRERARSDSRARSNAHSYVHDHDHDHARRNSSSSSADTSHSLRLSALAVGLAAADSAVHQGLAVIGGTVLQDTVTRHQQQ
jgi:hypothetical protein